MTSLLADAVARERRGANAPSVGRTTHGTQPDRHNGAVQERHDARPGPATNREPPVATPRNPVYALFVLNQRMRALLAVALRDAPIRADEYGVYSAIFKAGSLTPTQLARSTGMPLTTVADYVRAMVDRGHVQRRANPADGRSVLLSLSPAGHETVTAIMPAFTQAVRSDALRARGAVRGRARCAGCHGRRHGAGHGAPPGRGSPLSPTRPGTVSGRGPLACGTATSGLGSRTMRAMLHDYRDASSDQLSSARPRTRFETPTR